MVSKSLDFLWPIQSTVSWDGREESTKSGHLFWRIHSRSERLEPPKKTETWPICVTEWQVTQLLRRPFWDASERDFCLMGVLFVATGWDEFPVVVFTGKHPNVLALLKCSVALFSGGCPVRRTSQLWGTLLGVGFPQDLRPSGQQMRVGHGVPAAGGDGYWLASRGPSTWASLIARLRNEIRFVGIPSGDAHGLSPCKATTKDHLDTSARFYPGCEPPWS